MIADWIVGAGASNWQRTKASVCAHVSVMYEGLMAAAVGRGEISSLPANFPGIAATRLTANMKEKREV